MSDTITNPVETPVMGALCLQHWLYPVVPVAFGAGETSALGMSASQPANAVSRDRDAKQAAPPRGEVH